ncbi:MAG: hypothetical protein GJV46_00865 [Geobacter sp.]|nr:hypothetical protein [Geobacter sp.]
MEIKDILLYMNDSPSCERRIDTALNLAQTLNARVTGVTIVTYGYYQPHYLHTEEKTATAGALLKAKAELAGVPARHRNIESNVVGVSSRELLIHAAHCSDLVVVSQESSRSNRTEALVEHLITGCGRPVLVVPATGAFHTIGTRILVAWKNGREAARTLHDALPILQRADQVTVVTVTSGDESSQQLSAGIREHLQQHGVNVRTEVYPITSASLADNLLNHACDGGYDLLVMGAYSHGTRRGSQLGKVANQILREMTIPVFMSH